MSQSSRLVLGFITAMAAGCASNSGQSRPATGGTTSLSRSTSSVFVLGGIHQAHEKAKEYTYKRMGELFEHLHPDLLCVEVAQKSLDDGTDKGMPFDFKNFMVPSARRLGVPIVGIDWWDKSKGERWRQLQRRAYSDPSLTPEVALIGGVFLLLNDYFVAREYEDINSPEITSLWEAKSELKYRVFRKHPVYQFLFDFERERNSHMVDKVMQALKRHPGKRTLVAVGIDHKFYLERELRRRGVRVLTVKEVKAEWWR